MVLEISIKIKANQSVYISEYKIKTNKVQGGQIMRMECLGTMSIITNQGEIELNLWNLELSSYSGDDYINVTYFNYEAIFEDVVLCADKDSDDYDIPETQEEFNQSPLWADLGLNPQTGFEVLFIKKDLSINHYMTYGQYAGYSIDMVKEKVDVNGGYTVSNEIDDLIFGKWPSLIYVNRGYEVNGGDILRDMVEIYTRYSDKSEPDNAGMESEVKTYFNKVVDKEGKKLSESQIGSIISILWRNS